MLNKALPLAVSLYFASSAFAAPDYYVVVPLKGKLAESASPSIQVSLNTYPLPKALVGEAYSFNLKPLLSVTGDAAYTGDGVTWSVVSSTLPAGLYLTSDGFIGGTPTAAGTGAIKVRASYKTNNGEQSYEVLAASLTVSLTGAALPVANEGTPYSYDLKKLLSVTGDDAYNGSGVTWSVVSSTLPAGLYLTTDGYIGGTPTASGTGNITVRASYKNAKGEQTYQVVTTALTVTLATATLPSARVGDTYSYDFKPLASSNDPAFTGAQASFSATELPAGLSLAANGVLSGTPTTKNTTGATVQVVANYKTKTGQQAYTIVVNGATLQVTQVSAGMSHTCAVTTSGGVKCWGSNGSGQLGDNTTTNRLTPVDVFGLTSGVASVSAGDGYTCAITTAGAAKCWGANTYGQLGDNSTTVRLTPTAVSGLSSGVARISAGGYHTCGVLNTGAVKCWGNGALGNTTTSTSTTSKVPVSVYGLTSGARDVDVGFDGSLSCAVTAAGALKCWGYDGADINSPAPTTVVASGVSKFTMGSWHWCITTTAGAVQCQGSNENGELGRGTATTWESLGPVSGIAAGASDISSALNHTCAILSGALKCWGLGPLGDGTTATRTTPVVVNGLSSGVLFASGGGTHTCAVTTDGVVKCWGGNFGGKLGDGTTTQRVTPVDVQP